MRNRSSTPAPVFDEHDIAEMMSHFPHLEGAALRRRAQLGERPRRRVREQTEAVPLSFEDGAIDNLCDQLKAFLKRGAGQGGQELTYAEADDYWHELLDATHREPTAADEALEEAFGIRAPRRHRGAGQVPPGASRAVLCIDQFSTRSVRDSTSRLYLRVPVRWATDWTHLVATIVKSL
jgi:hypothetical protein